MLRQKRWSRCSSSTPIVDQQKTKPGVRRYSDLIKNIRSPVAEKLHALRLPPTLLCAAAAAWWLPERRALFGCMPSASPDRAAPFATLPGETWPGTMPPGLRHLRTPEMKSRSGAPSATETPSAGSSQRTSDPGMPPKQDVRLQVTL